MTGENASSGERFVMPSATARAVTRATKPSRRTPRRTGSRRAAAAVCTMQTRSSSTMPQTAT